jgi:hypothetical protein
MLLSAYANDRGRFMEAWRKAVAAYRRQYPDEPEEAERRVLASWRSRGPFERLRSKPTDIQLGQLYAAMPDRGADALRESIKRYAEFSSLIAPSPQIISRRLATPEDIRRRLIQSAIGSSGNPEAIRRQLIMSATSAR